MRALSVQVPCAYVEDLCVGLAARRPFVWASAVDASRSLCVCWTVPLEFRDTRGCSQAPDGIIQRHEILNRYAVARQLLWPR